MFIPLPHSGVECNVLNELLVCTFGLHCVNNACQLVREVLVGTE